MKIEASDLFASIANSGIDYITGVPDSVLRPLCDLIDKDWTAGQHVVACNEGGAIGLAIGHYLSNGKPTLVYMQNSGLGNAVNPLTSMAHKSLTGVPMVLLIGWRGDDGCDEPQHRVQGQITAQLLQLMDIPVHYLQETFSSQLFKALYEQALKISGPVAVMVPRGVIVNSGDATIEESVWYGSESISRPEAISCILEHLSPSIPLISTTGFTSRELSQIRASRKEALNSDFLVVGAMGHANQIASGVAQALGVNRRVCCLDGDGALLMHMGSMLTASRTKNLIHIVFNNGCHESVGGASTGLLDVDLRAVAAGFGYDAVTTSSSAEMLMQQIRDIDHESGSVFIEVKCRVGTLNNLLRPAQSMRENRESFRDFLAYE